MSIIDTEILTNESEAAQVVNLPFLIFKISDVLYAVNGETINSISVLDQPVTGVPMTESHIRGIINVRGEVVPLIDVRILFGLPTSDEESEAFSDMIESQKKDHMVWIETLEEAVKTNTDFTLATDPHKCKFGKWYDSYKADHKEFSFAFMQMDEPHSQLHECANEAIHHRNNDNAADGMEAANRIIEKAKNEYAKTLLALMDQIKDERTVSAKQMVVILQKDKTQIGILVDEVMEVTYVESVCSLSDITTTHHSRFVSGVGHAEEYDKDILMVDVEQIVHNSHNFPLGIAVV